MKSILFFLTCFSVISCATIGPKITYFKKDGVKYEKRVTYNYPEGVKTKMEELVYRVNDGQLIKETIFTEYWPNGAYHLISEEGFVLFDNGMYAFNVDSIAKPDNLIYEYYSKDFVPVIEVYKNGVREPFLFGYTDGHQTMEYLREPPGVYNWKNGVQYFERPFTEAEWESHRKMNEYLNSKNGPFPDSL